MRGRWRRGCRGGERRKRSKKDDKSVSKRFGRSPSPASPSSGWRRHNDPEICYIERTLDTDQREAAYEYLAVLVQITGTRPPVTVDQAREAIAHKYGIPLDEQLEIHAAAAPFDFFLILPDHASYQTPAFSLSIRPWTRLSYADHGALYHKVHIELEGIPPHVWQASTAVELLNPFCSVARIHPETTARRDLSVFRLTTWTMRPERIPETKILAVPELGDDEMAMQPMRHTLKYTVHLRRLLLRLPPESPPPSPPPTPPTTESSDDDDESPERAPRRAQSRERRPRLRRRRIVETPPPPTARDGTSVGVLANAHTGVNALPTTSQRPTGSDNLPITPSHEVNSPVPGSARDGAPMFKLDMTAPPPTEATLEAELLLCSQAGSQAESREDPMTTEATHSLAWLDQAEVAASIATPITVECTAPTAESPEASPLLGQFSLSAQPQPPVEAHEAQLALGSDHSADFSRAENTQAGAKQQDHATAAANSVATPCNNVDDLLEQAHSFLTNITATIAHPSTGVAPTLMASDRRPKSLLPPLLATVIAWQRLGQRTDLCKRLSV